MTLRLALEEDFHTVLDMARRFHSESPFDILPFDEASVRAVFDSYLADPSTTVFIMNDYGVIIGQKYIPPFTTVPVTAEIAWYVRPEGRGKASLELLAAYQDWSYRVGARVTQVAMLDGMTDLDKFYRRQGFTPAERSYIKVQ